LGSAEATRLPERAQGGGSGPLSMRLKAAVLTTCRYLHARPEGKGASEYNPVVGQL